MTKKWIKVDSGVYIEEDSSDRKEVRKQVEEAGEEAESKRVCLRKEAASLKKQIAETAERKTAEKKSRESSVVSKEKAGANYQVADLFQPSRERLNIFRKGFTPIGEPPPNPSADTVFVVLAAGPPDRLNAFLFEALLRKTNTGVVLVTESRIEKEVYPLLARTVVSPRELVSTCWASLEIVDNTVTAVRKALTRYPRCKSVHLVSGDSTPLRSDKNIEHLLLTGVNPTSVGLLYNVEKSLPVFQKRKTDMLSFINGLGWDEFGAMQVRGSQWMSIPSEIAQWLVTNYEDYRPRFARHYEESFDSGKACALHPGFGVCPDQQVLQTLIHIVYPLTKNPDWVEKSPDDFINSFKKEMNWVPLHSPIYEDGDTGDHSDCRTASGTARPEKCYAYHARLYEWNRETESELKEKLKGLTKPNDYTYAFRKLRFATKEGVVDFFREMWEMQPPRRNPSRREKTADSALFERGLRQTRMSIRSNSSR